MDPNESGTTTDLRLEEVFWGLLVDIHDLDENGDPSALPVYRDFVIGDTFLSTDPRFDLEVHPVTQEASLIIQREKDDTNVAQTFNDLLIQASSNLPVISEKNDDGTSVRFDNFASQMGPMLEVMCGPHPRDPLSLPDDAFIPYVCGLTANVFSQFDLGDGRAVLTDVNDPLLALTTVPGNSGFVDSVGFFDPTGLATMTLNIPPVPALSGFSCWMIGVSWNPLYASNIKSIVGPQAISIP